MDPKKGCATHDDGPSGVRLDTHVMSNENKSPLKEILCGLRFFKDLVRPASADPRAAPLHRVHPWGVGDPCLASQPMQRTRSGDAGVGSDGTSQRLRTRRSLQEARDHHVLAIGL